MGGGRRLQDGQADDSDFVIHGFVDVQGVSDILGGGLTQFVTDSGMKSCEVTDFEKRTDTLYILQTSCGQGTLVLTDEQSQNVGGGMRRLSSTNGAILYIWSKDSEQCLVSTFECS